jgi:glycosyltransferase involved in cell wall biosynthesis
MGYDLTSESGADLRFTAEAWALLLNLAEAYGWKPCGSAAPEEVNPEEWAGDYDSNDGQRVSREDAEAMAAALERALADPGRTEKERHIGRELNEELRRLEVEAFGEDLPPENEGELLTTDDQTLQALVGFLRAGSFTID